MTTDEVFEFFGVTGDFLAPSEWDALPKKDKDFFVREVKKPYAKEYFAEKLKERNK